MINGSVPKPNRIVIRLVYGTFCVDSGTAASDWNQREADVRLVSQPFGFGAPSIYHLFSNQNSTTSVSPRQAAACKSPAAT